MISLGVLLVILGVGSLVLPYLTPQLSLMGLVDPYQPWAGVIVAALGLITVLFGAQRRGRQEVAGASPAARRPAAAPKTYAATTAPAATPASRRHPSRRRPAGKPPGLDATLRHRLRPAIRAWPTEPPERSDD